MTVIIDPNTLKDDEVFRRLLILQVSPVVASNKSMSTYAAAQWSINYADTIIKELKKVSNDRRTLEEGHTRADLPD